MNTQDYKGRFYIISKGRIIGDFTNRSDADSLVKANPPKAPAKKARTVKRKKEQVPISAFGYSIDEMQQGKPKRLR